jgi:hypothetical protein
MTYFVVMKKINYMSNWNQYLHLWLHFCIGYNNEKNSQKYKNKMVKIMLKIKKTLCLL